MELIKNNLVEIDEVVIEIDGSTEVLIHKEFESRSSDYFIKNAKVISKKLVRKLGWTKYRKSGKYTEEGHVLVDWYDKEFDPWNKYYNRNIVNSIINRYDLGDHYITISDLSEYDLDPSYNRCYSRLILDTEVIEYIPISYSE